jgi:hypothetical protein
MTKVAQSIFRGMYARRRCKAGIDRRGEQKRQRVNVGSRMLVRSGAPEEREHAILEEVYLCKLLTR